MPYARLDGVTLNYQLEGDKGCPLVLFSNCFATNYDMWRLQVPEILRAGYRVLRYDSRGMGGSEVTPGPYSMELLADDIVALMDHVNVAEADVCGLSKGGMVAMMLATRHASRVRSVTLCDTSAHMPGARKWEERIEAIRNGRADEVVDAAYKRWFTDAGRSNQPGLVADILQMLTDTEVGGLEACLSAIVEMDQRAGLSNVRCPAQIIVGEFDSGCPVSHSEEIHGLLSGSSLAVLQNAAHFSNVDQPEAFNQTLLGFLERVHG